MKNLPVSPAIPGDLYPNSFIQVTVSGSSHFISRCIYHICGITLQDDQEKKKAADSADPTAKTNGRSRFCLIQVSKSLPSFQLLYYLNFHIFFHLNAASNFLCRIISAATSALSKNPKIRFWRKKTHFAFCHLCFPVGLCLFFNSLISLIRPGITNLTQHWVSCPLLCYSNIRSNIEF
jgi:hypothetical protein